ncbi:hypothetical protein [Microbacterium sp.]|uniref:hypothetical protein n=1 Tax=Microbacterium sp. TaxID=51671 RepID=UPI003A8F76AE
MTGTLRTRTRLLLALPIAAAAISLAACSGVGATGGDARPTADELSSGIATILEDAGQGDVLTADQLDCVAGEFLDSKVSDKDLQSLANGKDEQTSEEAKDLVSQTMSEAAMTCSAE